MDRFKITGIGGDVEFVNTGNQALLVMQGETEGGQRRRIHIELTRDNVREIHNVALAFLNEIGPRDSDLAEQLADEIFGSGSARLSAVDEEPF